MNDPQPFIHRIGKISTLLLLAGIAGCGEGIFGSGSEESIPRETFIETMVELRLTAYRDNTQGLLPEGVHEEILERHGIEVDDMMEFVEVHGRDIPFMNLVWSEIEGHVQSGLEAHIVETGQALPDTATPP